MFSHAVSMTVMELFFLLPARRKFYALYYTPGCCSLREGATFNTGKNMYDVVALGELLVDFTPCGMSDQDLPVYQANPGGAPCNVLSMLSKLGRKTAFIGKVGHDMFGKMLRRTLQEEGINDSGLVTSREVNTTLAFVQIDEHGDRDFSFYRNPGADMKLTSGEVDMALVEHTRLFHFGTISMTHDDVRRATRHAVSHAREKGSLISFDPNLRPPLWPSLELAREQMLYGCGVCSIIKIEMEELLFLTERPSMEEGLEALKRDFPNLRLILVTGGREGSWASYGNLLVHQPTFLNVKTIDTTGAGDSFFGSCLDWILETGLDNLTEQQLADMLLFANAAASIVTTRKGAIRSMPTREEVFSLIAKGF